MSTELSRTHDIRPAFQSPATQREELLFSTREVASNLATYIDNWILYLVPPLKVAEGVEWKGLPGPALILENDRVVEVVVEGDYAEIPQHGYPKIWRAMVGVLRGEGELDTWYLINTSVFGDNIVFSDEEGVVGRPVKFKDKELETLVGLLEAASESARKQVR
ncbi:MAG: hypothetical protein Q7S79_00100 [bacterium]|nr:hypothetical protein [bacterium]